MEDSGGTEHTDTVAATRNEDRLAIDVYRLAQRTGEQLTLGLVERRLSELLSHEAGCRCGTALPSRLPGCFGVRGGLESSAAGDPLHHAAGGAKAQVSAADEATGRLAGMLEEVGEAKGPPVVDRHVLVDAPGGVSPVAGDEEHVAWAELEESAVGVGPGGELGQIRGGDVDLGDVVANVAEGEGVEAGDLPRWAEDHLLSAADLREEVVGGVVMERGQVVAGAEPEIDDGVLVLVDEGGKRTSGQSSGRAVLMGSWAA